MVQGNPVEIPYDEQVMTLMLSWAHDFGLIEWVVDLDGAVTFVKACCAGH